MLFVFIIILIALFSCEKKSKKVSEEILLNTDRDFSTMSVNEGMFRAFLFYIGFNSFFQVSHSWPGMQKSQTQTISKRL